MSVKCKFCHYIALYNRLDWCSHSANDTIGTYLIWKYCNKIEFILTISWITQVHSVSYSKSVVHIRIPRRKCCKTITDGLCREKWWLGPAWVSLFLMWYVWLYIGWLSIDKKSVEYFSFWWGKGSGRQLWHLSQLHIRWRLWMLLLRLWSGLRWNEQVFKRQL